MKENYDRICSSLLTSHSHHNMLLSSAATLTLERPVGVGGTPAKMRHDERHGRWRRVKPSPRPVFRPVVIDLLLRSLFETGLGPNLCLLRVF